MAEIFSSFDLILNPTTPTGAIQKGTDLTPAKRRAADLCAVYANLAGNPALSVPFGKNSLGMPQSVQLTAAPCREALLLAAASILEEADHE
jgi:aspartyl-tRNA(Asn)/glutamyl-tRNA(Gln) amidotransferase subunit A